MEGLNALVELRFRKAFGLRMFDAIEVVLYPQSADLSDPPIDHRFFSEGFGFPSTKRDSMFSGIPLRVFAGPGWLVPFGPSFLRCVDFRVGG